MKYVVYGLGISGLSAAKYLKQAGNEVITTDDSLNNPEASAKPDQISYDSKTIISLSPGIFPTHKIFDFAKKSGAEIACDIEIFYRLNHQNNFIAITGTNGKSTTTALTGFVFKELNISSAIGGNIGIPCFDLPMDDEMTYIFETSSYQLDLLTKTHFKIAALLNITPDHLDHHGSMEAYIEAKKKIFQNQTEQDFALIDVDNENSRKVFEELKNNKNFRAKLIPISTRKIQENGVSLIAGKLVNKIAGADSHLELSSEFLSGQHNDQNMAFAFAITYCFGISDEKKIISAIQKFEGLPHRCKIVGQKDGIKFVNDSKATNAESTEPALKAFENIFWILGGRPKEGGISILAPYFNKIAKAYLIGEATEEFAKILEENSVNFEKCGDLKNAFRAAYFDAKKSSLTEKVLLLSPACASLDQWKNFEQRGDYFCKLVDEFWKS
ncbi:MAG: UDP-N-acetylmuramoyl-L-alanine--D-glutamate ligase [Proteobacteria bacterium]|nr:UDP-N-acetylmuramoyl-L-alanine--D-glutamate ligase [Pseudomonadota bacterium]